LRRRGLDLGELLAKVLHEHVVQSSTRLHRLLADQLEALIKPGEDLACDEDTRLEGLLHVGILGHLSHLLKDRRRPLGALPHVAEQMHEDFLRTSGCHTSTPILGDRDVDYRTSSPFPSPSLLRDYPDAAKLAGEAVHTPIQTRKACCGHT